jgi:uncharacterized membrane protein YgdD (TMEM256/DUF423 family)
MQFIVLAASIMFFGVVLGAFGAHALRDSLAATGSTSAWETAVLYHMVHGLAVATLGVWRAVWPPARRSRLLFAAGFSWALGILFFSGSLYILATGGPRAFGPVTPIGGGCFIAGWILLGAGAWRMRP